MYGIFVNEDSFPYAHKIVSGEKTYETRSRNMLKRLNGKRVAIISTRRGQKPMIIGYAEVFAVTYWSRETLDKFRTLTLIPEGSKYDCTGAGKWCYWMNDAEPCEPYPLPENAIRHGRSYVEF